MPKLKIVTTVARSELDQVAKSVGAQTAVQHSHVVSVQGVGDRELGVLYAHARATLAPSRYEGCGLVPLESLIAGTPVIVSDIPAHREGIGQTVEESEGVHWVSSPDIGVWASAMIESCRIQQSEAGIIPSSREVSESLRRSIVERHSIEKMREGLHRLYSHAFSHA